MSLRDLPDEILLTILDNVDNMEDNGHHLSLLPVLLTCQRLYWLGLKALYKRIIFEYGGSRLENQGYEGPRCLIQQTERQPERLLWIQCLYFSWKIADDHVRSNMLNLLVKLPSLKVITLDQEVSTQESGNRPQDFNIAEILSNSRSAASLRSVEIHGFQFYSHHIATLFALPSLQRLSIDKFYHESAGMRPFPRDALAGTSHNTSDLEIFRVKSESTPIGPGVEWMFLHNPNLRDLRWDLGTERSDQIILLAPIAITAGLSTLQHTLVKLCLTDSNAICSSDESRLNFSAYPCLKLLKVESTLLWRQTYQINSPGTWRSPHIEDIHFARRLPLSLETLEILFKHPYCVLRATENGEQSYRWIIDLARQKTSHLRHLQAVNLTEKFMLKPGEYRPLFRFEPCWEDCEWSYPQEVENAFEKADIELTVVLRPTGEEWVRVNG